jgi:hypothetical protein
MESLDGPGDAGDLVCGHVALPRLHVSTRLVDVTHAASRRLGLSRDVVEQEVLDPCQV